MSKTFRAVAGLVAAASLWALVVTLRAGEPIPWVMVVMGLVFGFYAVRGRGGAGSQGPGYGKEGAVGLDRRMPRAQVIIYLLLVFAGVVVLAVGKFKRWW